MEQREEAIVKNSLAKKKKNGANGNHNRTDKAGRYLYQHEYELGQFYSALLGYRNGNFTARLPHSWSGTRS
jgi:hypothetical protein